MIISIVYSRTYILKKLFNRLGQNERESSLQLIFEKLLKNISEEDNIQSYELYENLSAMFIFIFSLFNAIAYKLASLQKICRGIIEIDNIIVFATIIFSNIGSVS
jgi:hypothetical protein